VTAEEQITEIRAFIEARVRTCRLQEMKFARAWSHRSKHALGPPQALVEAWSERHALESVVAILESCKAEP
jgi:hypothetical protein